VKGRCIAMRENRSGSARENRRHPVAFAGQELARDERVDGPVQAVKKERLGAFLDRPR
jgi:hypothetical protein